MVDLVLAMIMALVCILLHFEALVLVMRLSTGAVHVWVSAV